MTDLISSHLSDAQAKEKTKTKEMSESLKDFKHLLLQAEVARRTKYCSHRSHTPLRDINAN